MKKTLLLLTVLVLSLALALSACGADTTEDPNTDPSQQEQTGDEQDAQRFFFRGQANIAWDVYPGVFRKGFLVTESSLIKEAYLRNPTEFRKLDTDFERLA